MVVASTEVRGSAVLSGRPRLRIGRAGVGSGLSVSLWNGRNADEWYSPTLWFGDLGSATW